ncbi:MAG: hypothetical protein Q3M30_19210 [Candidatus Electrothrix sp. Rat3]|nr:hypothetical protein [Candidatus Electrothrix rattekaaiensis]
MEQKNQQAYTTMIRQPAELTNKKHKDKERMKHLSIFSYIFYGCLINFCWLLCWLPAAVHAQTSGTNMDCPDGIYRGKVTFTFIKKDSGPITSIVDNMLFFYGGEPKDLPMNPNSLRLKNVMICTDGGEDINTTTKHMGNYTLLNKECDISLKGTGQIKDKELVEQGDAKLTCQDRSAYQGTYSITAINLLTGDGDQGNGVKKQGSGAAHNGSPSSGNTWNGLITEPESKNGPVGPKRLHPKKL